MSHPDSTINFSVIMPIYKGDNADHVNEAISSLYNQTVRATEVVIIQDGPILEELAEVLKSWKLKMPEIKHVELKVNQGLSNALNAGIDAASNEWLARMDADDICLPNRFEKQLSIIEDMPDLALLSSWIEEFDEDMNESFGIKKLPEHNQEIRSYAKWRCPFNHMTVFYRKSVLDKIGYYQNYSELNTNGFGEDYELWARFLVNGYEGYNIQEVLLKARTGKNFFEKRRRGWVYYQNELNVVRDLHKLGLINQFEVFGHAVSKAIIRLSPQFVVRSVYKILRKK